MMETPVIHTHPLRFLRLPSEKTSGESPEDIVEDETDTTEGDDEEYIRCRHCHQVITKPSERVEIHGSHQHTFANPHGIVFHIGCFRSCTGCGYVGPVSGEFTWFKGFKWRIAICTMCLTHLGWLFTSSGGHSFNGLILDRLTSP
jgi:hypothetical protein